MVVPMFLQVANLNTFTHIITKLGAKTMNFLKNILTFIKLLNSTKISIKDNKIEVLLDNKNLVVSSKNGSLLVDVPNGYMVFLSKQLHMNPMNVTYKEDDTMENTIAQVNKSVIEYEKQYQEMKLNIEKCKCNDCSSPKKELEGNTIKISREELAARGNPYAFIEENENW